MSSNCPQRDVEPETALKIVRAEIKDLKQKLAILKEKKLETEQAISNLREELRKQEISAKQKIADVSAEIIEQLRKKLEKLAKVAEETNES